MSLNNVEDLLIEYEQSSVSGASEDDNTLNRAAAYQRLKILSKTQKSIINLVKDPQSSKELIMKESFGEISNEFRILSKLEHPGIPVLLEGFSQGGSFFIVREYVKGEALEEKLEKQGCIPELQIVGWAIQICEILKYLHGMKPYPIIHRDLKPLNIICTENNELKLIDFDSAREYKKTAIKDTQCFGTVGYAAPEQFGFSQTDPRSDIFSLGILMHQLLTGKTPQRGEPPLPVRRINKKLSHEIEKIISKCCMFNPDQRYCSVEEVLADLNKIKRKGFFNKKYLVPACAFTVLFATVLSMALFKNSADGKTGSNPVVQNVSASKLNSLNTAPVNTDSGTVQNINIGAVNVTSLECSDLVLDMYELTLNYVGSIEGDYRIKVYDSPNGDAYSIMSGVVPKSGEYKFRIKREEIEKIPIFVIDIIIDGKDHLFTFKTENIRLDKSAATELTPAPISESLMDSGSNVPVINPTNIDPVTAQDKVSNDIVKIGPQDPNSKFDVYSIQAARDNDNIKLTISLTNDKIRSYFIFDAPDGKVINKSETDVIPRGKNLLTICIPIKQIKNVQQLNLDFYTDGNDEYNYVYFKTSELDSLISGGNQDDTESKDIKFDKDFSSVYGERIIDKTDYPFVDDKELLGSWQCVDYVKTPDFFDLESLNANHVNLNFSVVSFESNGKTDYVGTNWTKGYVIDKGQKTASKYIIKEIDGTKYMFMEWKSGDYTLRHRPPEYYVFKKTK